MNLLDKLAVQSFCFRHFKDNKDVAQKVLDIGLKRIEICAVHADFNDLEAWKKIVKIYQDKGIEIVSIGVQTFEGHESEETWFKCAEAAGAKHISAHFRVGTFPKAIAAVKKWSQQYGIEVGLHTHGGYMFGGSPDTAGLIVGLGAPQIGLCMDTAWVIQIGPKQGNPIDWARRFAGHMKAVHFKDFRFEPNGQWQDTVVGEGTLDLPGLLKALEDTGYQGVSILEYEADPENPVPALKACVEKMRALAS